MLYNIVERRLKKMIITKAVQKESKKTGNSYICLEITFSNGYTKVVFLDKAEEYMVAELEEIA